MEFRLFYEGPLYASNEGDQAKITKLRHKHDLRQAFSPQVKELWKYPPINIAYGYGGNESAYTSFYDPEYLGKRYQVNGQQYVPMIRKELKQTAEISVLMLRPEYPAGGVIRAGDIDNRLKTLFDALRVPTTGEVPVDYSPTSNAEPIYCLLEDDCLITSVTITTDTLLKPNPGPAWVILTLHIRVITLSRLI